MGLSGKDQAGFDAIEEPHLGKLFEKMLGRAQKSCSLLIHLRSQLQKEKPTMLDLNNVSYSDDGPRDFELIPDGTVVRAVMLSGGDHELPEFGGIIVIQSVPNGCLLSDHRGWSV